MMHGVKRTRAGPSQADNEEQKRKRAEKEAAKIAEYKQLLDQIRQRDESGLYDDELLQLTAKALSINPEYTTGWNVRRRTLLGNVLDKPGVGAEAKQNVLAQDLQLTNASLRYNPKNYNVWEHRKWVLEAMPDADWSTELRLVEAFLEKDPRNFHSWDYRRYCIQAIISATLKDQGESAPRSKPLPAITTASELAYTKRKVAENFSNFSAWHYRSKLLPRLWAEKGWEPGSTERLNYIDQEFELVRQAIWSDPNDQSVWLYHRWLVGDGTIDIVKREIKDIRDLLEEETDSRWCLESLHYYNAMLANLVKQQDPTESSRLNAENVEILDKLARVDPLRKHRYNDLKHHVVPYMRA